MIKPADENSPFAGVKFDGTLKNEGVTIGFARIVSQEDYYRGYQEGHKEAEKTLRDEIAMRAMQGILANPNLNPQAYFHDVIEESLKYADEFLKAREES